MVPTSSAVWPGKFARRYPWDEWFTIARTTEVVLVRGDDFDGLPHGMVGMIRNRARRDGLRVSVHAGNDSVSFRVIGRRPTRRRAA